MTTYRFSALAYALARMWRAWAVIVPVVVANAALQALLVWRVPDVGDWLPLVLVALASLAVFAIAYGLVASAALRVPDGHVGWPAAAAGLREHAGRFSLWAAVLVIATIVGLMLYTIPGLVVLAVTPFVLLAALDGRPNPLAANFHAMGERFWRWLATALVTGAVVLLGTVLAGFTAFFVRNPAASLVAWLVCGLVLAWFITAWALVYRSTSVAARG